MSSWIPSLFNPFADDDNPPPTSPHNSPPPKSPSSGAKDDLSAVFRGVAAFLAPPPPSAAEAEAEAASPPSSSSERIAGIKSDLAEIEGTFRSGFSLISSKIASNLLQLQNQLNDGGNGDVEEEEDDDEDEELGISDEILDFVMKIARRPELWTDFPLSLADDFHLSDNQREHAANIDHLVPEFETLRQKIGSQMSDGKFWLIYFVLLLPRLNEEDSKLLSTPQVAAARDTLLKKLQNKTDEETSEKPNLSGTKTVDDAESAHRAEEVDTDPSIDTQKQSLNEDDVSFSDLEEEEEDDDPSDKTSAPRPSTSEKSWVQLDENADAKQKADHHSASNKESEGEDSNDWLTVDDTDFDNLGSA